MAVQMAVVFDLDGTLIDSLPSIARAGNAVLTSEGLAELSVEQFRPMIGLGEQIFLDRLIAATELDAAKRDVLMERFISGYKTVSQDSRLFDGAQQALADIKSMGVPIGLCTNKPQAPLSVVLDSLNWQNMFDVVVAGDTLAVRKPYPEPLHLAFEKLGLQPDSSAGLYVGDSETDAQTAKRAKKPFALFTRGIRVSPVADIPHDVAFDDFETLPEIVKSYL